MLSQRKPGSNQGRNNILMPLRQFIHYLSVHDLDMAVINMTYQQGSSADINTRL